VSVVDTVLTPLDTLDITIPDRVEGVSFHPSFSGDIVELPRDMAFA